MFGEREPFELEIRQLLELYTLDDLLDELEITPEEMLTILLVGGHVVLPPWLEEPSDAETNED
jgi:hypothetical protein